MKPTKEALLHAGAAALIDVYSEAGCPVNCGRRQSNHIKEIIRNDIMCMEADIQQFWKKMMVTPAAAAPPRTEGMSAVDGTGGSSPPAEQDSDYESTDKDLLLVELAA